MNAITKPLIPLAVLPKNELGLTVRDYEGAMSTLCAGCGHDAISAAIIQACHRLSLPPHRIAKLSGIGCSSKTPTYFVRGAHGFNSAHGLVLGNRGVGDGAASYGFAGREDRGEALPIDRQALM